MHAPLCACHALRILALNPRNDLVAGESRPKELFTELPIVWLKPQQHRTKPETGVYDCPV